MKRKSCLFLVLVLLAGCRKTNSPSAVTFPKAPVILISIDTLRADRLPSYGYGKGETPALDAFRKEAILFESAYTHVTLTLPSHASIFTGTVPAVHGIHDNLGYQLAKGLPTLAETLKKNGYATGGAISAVVLSSGSGISRGFDFWDDAVEPTESNQALGRVQRPGKETSASLQRWLDGAPAGPVLAFLHLYEPHAPYEPPEPWRSRLASDPYDGEVATADAVVGGFLAHLKEKGLYDKSVILIFSDHGEGLGEHGENEHGFFLYRNTIHVPLFLRLPGGARGGESVRAAAGLSDIYPTVLSLLGLPKPSLPGDAVPLLALADPKTPARRIFSETFFPRIHLGWSELSSLEDAQHHYIEAPRPEFYDMKADPGETSNLIAEKPSEFRLFKVELEKLAHTFVKPGAVDKEEAAKLAALGYISAGGVATGPLPDPKDKIGTVTELKHAFGLFAAEKNEEAARAFEAILAANPGMSDVWDAYAHALFKMGRLDESLVALKKGIEQSPAGATTFLISAATLYLELGKLDEAEKHAELARDNGNPAADDILSRVYLAKKDLPRAEVSARKALDRAGIRRLPYLTLARIEIAKGNLPAALALLDEAQRKTDEKNLRQIQSLHQLRGDVFGRTGRPAEAENELLAEIRLFPKNADAFASLAMLYGAAGRLDDSRLAIAGLVAGTPTPTGYATAIRVSGILGDRAGVEEWRKRARVRFPGDPRFGS